MYCLGNINKNAEILFKKRVYKHSLPIILHQLYISFSSSRELSAGNNTVICELLEIINTIL
jgi:hypothetical protein